MDTKQLCLHNFMDTICFQRTRHGAIVKKFFVLFKEIAFFESLCYTMLYPARGRSMKFKDKVVKAREILFISQKTLADKVGVSFATINRWEQGHTEPTLITKAKFEKFCHENNIKF